MYKHVLFEEEEAEAEEDRAAKQRSTLHSYRIVSYTYREKEIVLS